MNTDDTTACFRSPDYITSTNELETKNHEPMRKEYKSEDGFVDEETRYTEFKITNLVGDEFLIKGTIIEIDSNVLYIRLKDNSNILCFDEHNLPPIIIEYIRDH